MLKRVFDSDGGGEDDDGSSSSHRTKKQRPLLSALRDLMRLPSVEAFPLLVESFIRPMVREEAEKAIYCLSTDARPPPFNEISSCGARPWRLQFMNKLPRTIYAGSRICAVDNSPVQISIIDCASNMIIQSGSLASIKANILVIDGEFGGGEKENWTEEEFNNSLVRERDGKRPLLNGNLILTLKDGVGSFGDICFTDNSCWIRSRQFRLGIKAQQCNMFDGDIQEAVSGAFIVKDHRGELFKKNHPPSLKDEVWRLERIRKDGTFHRRLAEKEIHTVADFLHLLTVNQGRLRDILGTGMSDKIWNIITEHARECHIDDKIYTWKYDEMVTLHLNSIFEVIGAQFGSIYQPSSALDIKQKAFVNKLSEIFYGKRNGAIENPELLCGMVRSSLENPTHPSTSITKDHMFMPPDEPAISTPIQPTLPYDVFNYNSHQFASHVEEKLDTDQQTIASETDATLQIQSGGFRHDAYHINYGSEVQMPTSDYSVGHDYYRSEIDPSMRSNPNAGNFSSGIAMRGAESFCHQTAALMQENHRGFQ